MPGDYVPEDTYFDDDGTDFDGESSGSHEFKEVILQQSVTMLAYMERTTHNATYSPGITDPRMLMGFSVSDVTILVAAIIGAAALIVIILTTIAVWHCCRIKNRPDKAYCLDNSTPEENLLKPGNALIQSDSVVFVGTKNNQVATRAIGLKSDICQSILTRSQSVPLKEGKEIPRPPILVKTFPKRRPVSQPVHLPLPFQPTSYSSKRSHSVHPHNYYRHLEEVDMPLTLPSIPEGFRSSEVLHDTPHTLYASCNALDGASTYSSLYTTIDPNTTMKTRSLPLWGRTKPRPLSTEDDINELYAKVNFSKKRKNRMRSDSAAAIAANKSRSSYSTIPSAHKDTDSLVANEAVVVYDERTAL